MEMRAWREENKTRAEVESRIVGLGLSYREKKPGGEGGGSCGGFGKS
jgi:hypothetical protein